MFSQGQLYPENVINQNWNASREPVYLGKVKKLEKFKTKQNKNQQKNLQKHLNNCEKKYFYSVND